MHPIFALMLASVAPPAMPRAAIGTLAPNGHFGPRVLRNETDPTPITSLAGLKVEADDDLCRLTVDWSEDDSARFGLESHDSDTCCRSLLAQVAGAVKVARCQDYPALAMVEYFDRSKRGNPRNVRVRVTPTHEGVHLALA